jgi:hypothetical protein
LPVPDVLQTFTEGAAQRMVNAVQPYYDAVEQYGSGSLQAQVAQSIARRDLERAVYANHVAAARLGSAGGSLTAEAKAVLSDIIGTDTYYVERFADELPDLSLGQALVRANLYVSTQRNTITDITTLELPTLPVYPKDDSLICTWHCKCNLRVSFLFGKGNYDVYWDLDPAGREHCEDCIRLASTWRPLQIRAGQIVGQKMLRAHDRKILKAAFERLAA